MLAAALNGKGHILAELAIYGLPEAIWVDLNRDRVETVTTSFDRHIIADDVVVSKIGNRVARLMVVGPRATGLVARVAGHEAAALPPWQHRQTQIDGVSARLIASRWLAMPGYDVLVPAERAGEVWDALTRAGGPDGLRPVGLAALEHLRVEAGWPWYGVDFDESHLLMEALTRGHVSFTKGCYIGQEVVIRIEHQGHVNKRLCGLLLSGEALPPVGSALRLGERKMGTLTSAIFSPELRRVIALGYVRHECWAPGTELDLVSGDNSAKAEVTGLPIIGAAS
jgi:folate-binding protein YgfZ